MKKVMKAIAINNWGNANVFGQVQMPVPTLEENDVLVKVAFAGLNPADWKMRAGHLADVMPGFGFPLVLGLDASGTVVATGKNVTDLSVGDRVASATNLFHSGTPGSYAQYLVVHEQRAVKLPESVSFAAAATLNTPATTAWQALISMTQGEEGDAEGKTILINGASGGVGSFAVQLAKYSGAEVATTSSTKNISYVKSLGSDFLIDYKTQDITQELKIFAPDGVDFILDAVSAGSLSNPLDMLKPGGTLISIATITDDEDLETSMAQAKEKGVNHIYAMVSDEGMKEQLTQIVGLADSGKIILPPTEIYKMEDISEAHQRMETGHVQGKFILEIKH